MHGEPIRDAGVVIWMGLAIFSPSVSAQRPSSVINDLKLQSIPRQHIEIYSQLPVTGDGWLQMWEDSAKEVVNLPTFPLVDATIIRLDGKWNRRVTRPSLDLFFFFFPLQQR